MDQPTCAMIAGVTLQHLRRARGNHRWLMNSTSRSIPKWGDSSIPHGQTCRSIYCIIKRRKSTLVNRNRIRDLKNLGWVSRVFQTTEENPSAVHSIGRVSKSDCTEARYCIGPSSGRGGDAVNSGNSLFRPPPSGLTDSRRPISEPPL